jgi:hypothetical protein
VAGHNASHVVGWNDDGVARPTVLIVDDHDAFRGAARSLLEMETSCTPRSCCSTSNSLTSTASLWPIGSRP